MSFENEALATQKLGLVVQGQVKQREQASEPYIALLMPQSVASVGGANLL